MIRELFFLLLVSWIVKYLHSYIISPTNWFLPSASEKAEPFFMCSSLQAFLQRRLTTAATVTCLSYVEVLPHENTGGGFHRSVAGDHEELNFTPCLFHFDPSDLQISPTWILSSPENRILSGRLTLSQLV